MFFKDAENTRVEEIRKYIPVSVATSFANISALIGSAESKFILPLLGQTLYTQVLAYYTDSANPPAGVDGGNSAKFDTLIEHIQRALINLTYYANFNFLGVSINDAGFHRQETETQKSLYKYQEEEIKNSFKDAGFNGLDTMLEFIEENPTVFLLFTASPSYTLRKESVIPNTKVFDEIINISGSRLVFLKLRRFMTEVEDFVIKSELGDELFADMKTEIVKDNPSQRIASLLPIIQKPLAHLAMSKAFQTLGIHVRDRGVFFLSQEATQSNSSKEKPIDKISLDATIKAEESTGQFYLSMLRDFLVENNDTYSEITRTTGMVVNQESCVQWKGYQYVVPQKYLYELCPVRITDDHLEVYSSHGEQITIHPLAKKGQKERYVGTRQKSIKKPDLLIADVISRLEGLSPDMSEYIMQIKRHKPGSFY